MNRIISIFMSLVMIFSVGISSNVFACAAAPAHSPRENVEVCSHSNRSIWQWSPYYEEYSETEHYKIEEFSYYCLDCREIFSNKWTEEWKEKHIFLGGECRECGYKIEECSHAKTRDYEVDSWYEKYNDSKHLYVEEYETICRSCDEVVDEYTEKIKEVHNFSNDKCVDCGYQKNCLHTETKHKAQNHICKEYNSKVHECKELYYVVCTSCGEVLSEYYETEKEEHDIEDGECEDCGYVIKNCSHSKIEKKISYWDLDLEYYEYDVICIICNTKIRTEASWGDNEEKEEKHNCSQNANTEEVDSYYSKNDSESHYLYTEYETSCTKCEKTIETYTLKIDQKHTMSNSTCTKCGYVKTATNNTNSETNVQKPTNNSNTSGNTPTKNEETIEWIFIDSESSKFSVDEKVVSWQARPIIDPDGNMQVPLRQMAEIMGWKVSWDSKKNHAIVTKGNVTKTFMQGIDVYQIKDKDGIRWGFLKNDVQNVNGTLYVDLDGVLDCTGYSFYIHNAQYYHILPRSEVISQVATSRVLGNVNVVGSKTILADPQFELEVHQNEMLFMVIENEDGTRSFAAFVPVAEQALKGNYYEGEITWQGVIGEIIVGELPGVGTAADFRDIAADFQNWEWSWAHAGQTAIDMVGLIPFVGCLKYTDEVGTLLKKSGKVADVNVTKTAQKFMDQAASYDELAEATTKTLADYLKKAKAAIKNVDDLKALAKNPDIYAHGKLEHIFFGNNSGGLHYNGLAGANGKIIEITKPANKYGIYGAIVEVDGVEKYSTFFPDNWTPQQVLDAIDEAYNNRVFENGNTYSYVMKNGLEINMYLDDNGLIKSVFPVYVR